MTDSGLTEGMMTEPTEALARARASHERATELLGEMTTKRLRDEAPLAEVEDLAAEVRLCIEAMKGTD